MHSMGVVLPIFKTINNYFRLLYNIIVFVGIGSLSKCVGLWAMLEDNKMPVDG